MAAPAPGDRVNLAAFGHVKGWSGPDAEAGYSRKSGTVWRAVAEAGTEHSNLGIEWDEPRDFDEVHATFQGDYDASAAIVEYWVSSWPPPEGRGGWTVTDSPFNGKWMAVQATRVKEAGALIYRFDPLSAAENPNAAHKPGWSPRFRRALKVRLRFSSPTPPVLTSLQVFGRSRWGVRDVLIESGCEGKQPATVTLQPYNGEVRDVRQDGARLHVRVLYTEHEPDSNDRTILTLRTPSLAFGVAVDDLLRRKGIYVRDAGIFVGDGATAETFASYLASGRMRLGQDIRSRVSKQPEQTLNRAMAEIPALSMTNRRPFRYVPLGFFGNREKYGLMFNGNVFVSKHDSKLFSEEVARMLWTGDSITYRLGSGAIPDFRERENAARQHMLEGTLPVAITKWSKDGVQFQQEAFATLRSAPLDPVKNRGDEPSVLLQRVTATNATSSPADVVLWFAVEPAEELRLRGNLLEAVGDGKTTYVEPRLRAFMQPAAGTLDIASLPVGSAYTGRAARWQVRIPAGASVNLDIHLAFMTPVTAAAAGQVTSMGYDVSRDAVVRYWRAALKPGMRLHVPDETLNSFFEGALQHILLSVYRDVPTGLYMAPCGTYRYNMFANETNMQARLLDMRGMHDWAAKFMEPFVALQGSKPFPGRFRETAAIFHGVRVDKDHDYTHSGYNLNHGWTLWTLSEHYLLSRDRGWLDANLPAMKRAAEWIISERKATMRTDEDGGRVWEFGLLPAGQLEDNEEWLYWYAVNGYAYRGLNTLAAALADTDAVAAARYKEEAARYRADIRAAAMASMAAAPVAELMDGTWVPVVPSRTSMHGRDLGWIRNILYGALAMVDCGIFDPSEPVVDWILKDHEDNLFMAPWSFSVAESDWFSRGGITLQPNLVNTPLTYLQRDEIPQALRGLFNTFGVSYYPDVNCFTEWEPSFGTSGGPFYKTSDEAGFLAWLRLFLVREDGDTLRLTGGAPKGWFRPGDRIEVKDAATYFGNVSFSTLSQTDAGHVDAEVQLPSGFRGRMVSLRVRHPDGKRILRVERNGAPWPSFDGATETVELPPDAGRQRLRIFY